MTKIDAPSTTGAGNAEPMKVWVRMRGSDAGGAKEGTPELYFSDPDALVVQLQDSTYCGGSGPLGSVCSAVEPSPKKGVLSLKDLSHFTIFGSDAQRANKFYQDLFGLNIQASQGPGSPLLGVGDKIQFVMFGGGGGGRGGANATPRPASINHVCMNMENFNSENVLKTLTEYGIKPRGNPGGAAAPLVHYVSMRMENRGGAKEGTPELYFTDPDGLLIQLQDVTYCGGGGVLGNVCG